MHDELHRALHQCGKIRSSTTLLIVKRRRYQHVVRELIRLGYGVELAPELNPTNTDAPHDEGGPDE
jgi:hypothetical protein